MTATIGFLSVRQHHEHGYFGGYLIVNQLARPLEFHCTLPVKPSRAQALLYGPTIHDFVCGEQIAKALIVKAKLKPDLVITDSVACLAASQVCDIPLVQLTGELPAIAAGERLSLPASSAVPQHKFEAEGQTFAALADSRVTQPTLVALLSQLSDNFDLAEPFQRVLEALLEAHPIAKAA